jgi:cobalamin synthase
MTPFWIALQFLTVLPIELKTIPTAQQNGRAILFYPLVGLIVGGILFLVTCIFVKLPALLLAANRTRFMDLANGWIAFRWASRYCRCVGRWFRR